MDAVLYPTRSYEKDTRHTLSLLDPWLPRGASFLDVGCGEGFVAAALSQKQAGRVATVDVGDFRKVPTPGFQVYDGTHLPFEADSFDVVNLGFVLHHVPDVRKPLLLAEALRVCRHHLVIIEDTPETVVDQLLSWTHGMRYRCKIGSQAAFGFLSRGEWAELFELLGAHLACAQRLPRLCRSATQPYARTLFVIEKIKRPSAST